MEKIADRRCFMKTPSIEGVAIGEVGITTVV